MNAHVSRGVVSGGKPRAVESSWAGELLALQLRASGLVEGGNPDRPIFGSRGAGCSAAISCHKARRSLVERPPCDSKRGRSASMPAAAVGLGERGRGPRTVSAAEAALSSVSPTLCLSSPVRRTVQSSAVESTWTESPRKHSVACQAEEPSQLLASTRPPSPLAGAGHRRGSSGKLGMPRFCTARQWSRAGVTSVLVAERCTADARAVSPPSRPV